MGKNKVSKQQQVSVSPYKDFTLGVYWDNNKNALVPQNLTTLYQQSGANNVTLAFITTQTGAACIPAWGGYAEYSANDQPKFCSWIYPYRLKSAHSKIRFLPILIRITQVAAAI